jgi:hypothetical protein
MIQYNGLKGPNIMTKLSRLFILCSVIDGIPANIFIGNPRVHRSRADIGAIEHKPQTGRTDE